MFWLHRALFGSRFANSPSSLGQSADGAAAIQYFAVVDGPTMTPLDDLTGSVRILASIALGDTRLLDNIGIELA